MLKLRAAGVISLIIALVFTLILAGAPGPAMGKSTQHPLVKEPVPQAGPVKSYGAGQVLDTFNVDMVECWARGSNYFVSCDWCTCADFDKFRGSQAKPPCKTFEYVFPRVVRYQEFTVPSQGALVIDMVLEKDAAHWGSLGYNIQRYDDASGKWVLAGNFYSVAVTIENGKVTSDQNTKFDWGQLIVGSNGFPSHPKLTTLSSVPAGKYRWYIWSGAMSNQEGYSGGMGEDYLTGKVDAYQPGKGTFKVIFVPEGAVAQKYQIKGTLYKMYNVISMAKSSWTDDFKKPWANLLVAITCPDGKLLKTKTAWNGEFSVEVPVEGTYTVEVEDCHIFNVKEEKWQVAVPDGQTERSIKDDYEEMDYLSKIDSLKAGEALWNLKAPNPNPFGMFKDLNKEGIMVEKIKNMTLSAVYGQEYEDSIKRWANKKWKYIKCTDPPSPTGQGLSDALANLLTSGLNWLSHVERDPKLTVNGDVIIMNNTGSSLLHSIDKKKIQLPNGVILFHSILLIHQDEKGTAVYVLEGLATEWNSDFSSLQGLAWSGWKIVHNFGSDKSVMEPFTWQEADELWRTGHRPDSKYTETDTGTTKETNTTLVAESRTATPNSTIQVPIRLNNAGNIGSMNFVVTYNPQVLRVNRVDSGSLLSGALFTPNYQSPPEVRCGVATSGGVNGSGTMAYIEFQVIGTAGSSSPLTISELSSGDASGQSITVNSQNGTVTVATSKLKGDYNGDGKLSEVDALAALRMSVKLLAQDLTLDMNGDGKLTAEDARLIIKKALGK